MEKTDPLAVGLRLRAVMVELGFDESKDFARVLGTVPSAVTNWMNGYNRPNIEAIGRLIRLLPDLTMEWVYFGDAAKVPTALALRLDIRVQALEQGLPVPVVLPVPKPVMVRPVRSRKRLIHSQDNAALFREKA